MLLARAFHARGDAVVILSRAPAARPAPCRAVAWDAMTLGDWAGELDGADLVINLAGRNVNCRYKPENRRQIMASRVDSTRVVGAAIARATRPPPLWLQASTATIYAVSVALGLLPLGFLRWVRRPFLYILWRTFAPMQLFYALVYYPAVTLAGFDGDWATIYDFSLARYPQAVLVAHLALLGGLWWLWRQGQNGAVVTPPDTGRDGFDVGETPRNHPS